MGQDKKQLTKLLEFVKELYDHPDNKEFAEGIREMVLSDTTLKESSGENADLLKEMYEFCIRKFLSEQAEDMYKNFPLPGIARDLSLLFVEMEHARRKNDLDAFGFFLFRQIELITSTLVNDEDVSKIYDAIRQMMPFLKYDKQSRTRVRAGDRSYSTVEEFILISTKAATEKYKSRGKQLKDLSSLEKIRAIIYIVILRAEVDAYHPRQIQDFSTLSSIYNLRNHYAHSGVNGNDNQNEYYKKIQDDKTQNSLKYLSFLLMFIQGISENYPLSDSLLSLAGIEK